MNLAEFQINPALKDKWEAVDLGIVLARRWYWPLFISWLIPAAIVFFPLLFLFPESAWISGLATWWLKPLFDRVPLFFLSRYIFGENTSFAQSKKELFAAMRFSLFSALTWRRFDISRSFHLAVTVLEKQSGKALSARCNLLQRNCGGAAFWITIVLVHVEMLISISLASLAFLFIPQGIELDFIDIYHSEPLLYTIVQYLLYFVAVVFIAPFYVACGFSLYINRRIELEAWDLEIAFRRSVQDRESNKNKLKGAAPSNHAGTHASNS